MLNYIPIERLETQLLDNTMTSYAIIIGNNINILDISSIEKKSLMNVLSDKPNTDLNMITTMVRSNTVSSIYIIESDGSEEDLLEYMNENEDEFVETVKDRGNKIYSR